MEATNDLAIECRGMTKDYPGHRALDGISLEVRRGSFHGFLGPNGAGKTTTMRILSGLLGFDAGELFLQGEPFEKVRPKLSQLIGLMPEIPPLYQSLTVYDMLGFAGQLKLMTSAQIKQRRAHLVERCQLADVLKRYIGTLSKGFKQRVGLAVALMHNPSIVILDEPTVGLDPVSLGPIRDLLKGLKGEHTVLFSSHILSEVQMLCDSVTIIDRGKVLKSGQVQEIAASLQERVVYHLEVRGEINDLIARIEDLEGVFEVKEINPERLEIHSDPKVDPRSKISHLVIENNLQLLGLSRAELSLEEIFKQVTNSKERL